MRAQCIPAANLSAVLVTTSIPYGDTSLTKQWLCDLYLPPAAQVGPFPLLVLVHGGGFFGGGRSEMGQLAYLYMQRLGYHLVCLAVDYRTTKQVDGVYPNQHHDVEKAIAWARTNLNALVPAANIDPNKIGVLGVSSGATLALMVARDTIASGQTAGAGVRCAIGHSAPNDLYKTWVRASTYPDPATRDNVMDKVPRYVGYPPFTDMTNDPQKAALLAASAWQQVANTPNWTGAPAIYVGGSEGEFVPPDVATAFAAQLTAWGVTNELHLIAGDKHVPEQALVTSTVAFLQARLL